jgi:hypothetical protein
MDFSSTELFVEILIAGALFALGLSPLVALVTEEFVRAAHPAVPAESHGPERFLDAREWKDLRKWMIAVAAVAVIYALGVAGNRIVEVTYKIMHIGYPELSVGRTGIKAANQELITKGYAALERDVRNRGETYRDWVERHKSYRKILRAGSASSVMFVISTLVYAGARRKSYLARNVIPCCSVAFILALFFTFAYLLEDEHFKRDLADYHDDVANKGPPPGAK